MLNNIKKFELKTHKHSIFLGLYLAYYLTTDTQILIMAGNRIFLTASRNLFLVLPKHLNSIIDINLIKSLQDMLLINIQYLQDD